MQRVYISYNQTLTVSQVPLRRLSIQVVIYSVQPTGHELALFYSPHPPHHRCLLHSHSILLFLSFFTFLFLFSRNHSLYLLVMFLISFFWSGPRSAVSPSSPPAAATLCSFAAHVIEQLMGSSRNEQTTASVNDTESSCF